MTSGEGLQSDRGDSPIFDVIETVGQVQDRIQGFEADQEAEFARFRVLQDVARSEFTDKVLPERIKTWDLAQSYLEEQPFALHTAFYESQSWSTCLEWRLRSAQESSTGQPVNIDLVIDSSGLDFDKKIVPEIVLADRLMHRGTSSFSKDDAAYFGVGKPQSLLGVPVERKRKVFSLDLEELRAALQQVVFKDAKFKYLSFDAYAFPELGDKKDKTHIVRAFVHNPTIYMPEILNQDKADELAMGEAWKHIITDIPQDKWLDEMVKIATQHEAESFDTLNFLLPILAKSYGR